jgi:hypothetical protein
LAASAHLTASLSPKTWVSFCDSGQSPVGKCGREFQQRGQSLAGILESVAALRERAHGGRDALHLSQ